MDVDACPEKPFFVVKTLTDRSIRLDYSQALTIADVKARMGEKEGLSFPQDAAVRLVLRDTVLADDTTLGSLFPEEPSATDQKKLSEEDQSKKQRELSEARKLYWFYYEPAALLVDPIDVISEWDAKNRMRIFKGLYCFSQRRFLDAANLLCDSLSTFADTEFISFASCVKYAVIAASFTLDRPSLLKKVLRSSEVLEVIHQLPACERLVKNLYECRYEDFFRALADVEQDLKGDWLAAPHYSFICRELRIVSYNQLLRAYRSLSLQSMAASFGVTPAFIERELAVLVAAGRICCTIDQVAGLVHTRIPDCKAAQYAEIVAKSDRLLDDMQKLVHAIQ